MKTIKREMGQAMLAAGLALAMAGAFPAAPCPASQSADTRARLVADLERAFDLAGPRAPEVHYFRMETQFVHIGFDGSRTGVETYVLTLKCVPAPLSGKDGDAYTCRDFRMRVNDGPEVTIPALKGWSYVFAMTPSGMDEGGQVFGIPHAKFENLIDSRGTRLPVGIGYAVYNNFIDFHGFNDVFARPAAGGKGIQDLETIGQKIVHAAAFSEPPVNLGAGIKEGSIFRNGEVTLDFKGLSVIDGAPCALVGYDSGESTLKMIMPTGPDKDIVTEGGSEYMGDIFIDLATRWVRRVTMGEFVVTRTTMPGPMPKIDSYTARHILMRMISREEYEKQ